MNKKAQSQIITVVLLILLVIAAVVIIWQVVNSTVSKGGEQIDATTNCLLVNVKISSLNSTTLQVTRGSDSETSAIGVIVLVNGARNDTYSTATLAKPFDGAKINFGTTLPTGTTIEVAPILNGQPCTTTDTRTI
jgi:flagellin-like protein